MRIAIVTEGGEVPIASGELADEIAKRINGPLTRLVYRKIIYKTIDDIIRETRSRSVFLGPEHK